MCDPIGMIGLAFSVGMAGMQYAAQQEMAEQQNAANEQWLAYQRQKAQEEEQRQRAARLKAEASRQETLTELGAQKQKQAQVKEEQRLTEEITPEGIKKQGPELVGDKLLSGQQSMSDYIKGDMSNKITQAARDARARIAALATVQSYGGSQFGLANRANDLLGKSMQDIRLQADVRRGSLAAYGAEKQVEPIRYSMSGGGGLAGGLSNLGAQIGGQRIGTALGQM
jgi:hypothetical protein